MSRAFGRIGFLLALASGSLALAADAPTKVYKDSVHKCSFNVFPSWEPVPPKPGESWVVANFYDGSSRNDFFRSELTVVRIDHGAGNPLTGVDPSKLSQDEIKEKLKEAIVPDSVWDCTAGRLIIQKGAKEPDKTAFKPITSDEKVEGKIWQFEQQYPEYAAKAASKDDAVLFATLVTYEKDKIEYGLYMTTTGRREKDYKNAFKRIGQSFKFFNEKAGEVKSLDVLKGVNISPKRKAEIERTLVSGWGVEVSPKKNYVVVYNKEGKRNDQLAKLIATRIELLREQVYEKVFPPLRPINTVSIVKVCGNQKEYAAYGAPPGTAGYWSSYHEELVFYDASPAKDVDDLTIAVLYHEAFHQYIFYSVGNVAPHSWFNEGHGDYFAGARFKGGKFKIEPFEERVPDIKAALVEGPRSRTVGKDPTDGTEKITYGPKGWAPVADIVKWTQPQYYDKDTILKNYAEGWSIVWFLREVVPKRPDYNKKWGNILDTYFNTLKDEVSQQTAPRSGSKGKDGKDGEDGEDGEKGEDGEPGGDAPPPRPLFVDGDKALDVALAKAFEGVDMAEFEKAWLEATKNL